jgi:hypothetical protein
MEENRAGEAVWTVLEEEEEEDEVRVETRTELFAPNVLELLKGRKTSLVSTCGASRVESAAAAVTFLVALGFRTTGGFSFAFVTVSVDSMGTFLARGLLAALGRSISAANTTAEDDPISVLTMLTVLAVVADVYLADTAFNRAMKSIW